MNGILTSVFLRDWIGILTTNIGIETVVGPYLRVFTHFSLMVNGVKGQ